MIRQPPMSTRTDKRVPNTTLFRSPILRRAVKGDVPEIRALTFAAYAKWVGVTPRPPRPVTADYDGAFRDHRFDLLVEGGTLVAFIETVAEGEIGRAHV